MVFKTSLIFYQYVHNDGDHFLISQYVEEIIFSSQTVMQVSPN